MDWLLTKSGVVSGFPSLQRVLQQCPARSLHRRRVLFSWSGLLSTWAGSAPVSSVLFWFTARWAQKWRMGVQKFLGSSSGGDFFMSVEPNNKILELVLLLSDFFEFMPVWWWTLYHIISVEFPPLLWSWISFIGLSGFPLVVCELPVNVISLLFDYFFWTDF